MYSVKEVANSLGVSRQAVYKRINKGSFKEYLIVEGDLKYISEEGLQLLKDGSIKAKEIVEECRENFDKESTGLTTSNERLFNTLDSVIISKDKDIEHLREENKRLLELMQQQNQLLHDSQKMQQQALSNTELLLLEKRQQLMLKEAEYKLNIKLSLKERIRILFKGTK